MVDREAEATVTYTKSMGTYRSKSALNSAVSEDLDAFTDQCLGYVKQALAETGEPRRGLPFVERLWRVQPERQQHRQRHHLYLRWGVSIQRYGCLYGHVRLRYHTTAAQEAKVTSRSLGSSKGFGLPAAPPTTPNS